MGLGMTVVAHDPFASEAKAAALGVRLVSFDQALADGDFFSLHMPLTPQTKVRRMPAPGPGARPWLLDALWKPAPSVPWTEV